MVQHTVSVLPCRNVVFCAFRTQDSADRDVAGQLRLRGDGPEDRHHGARRPGGRRPGPGTAVRPHTARAPPPRAGEGAQGVIGSDYGRGRSAFLFQNLHGEGHRAGGGLFLAELGPVSVSMGPSRRVRTLPHHVLLCDTSPSSLNPQHGSCSRRQDVRSNGLL